MEWEEDARIRLAAVPEGYCRDMTMRAVEAITARSGSRRIDLGSVEAVLDVFEQGSQQVSETLEWTEDARDLLARVPDMVRGMLIREIESAALRSGKSFVDGREVDAVRDQWLTGGAFHLDPTDPRGAE